MNLVVTDTGPLLHLHEAGFLTLFAEVGGVRIPPAVEAESTRLIRWGNDRPAWLTVIELDAESVHRAAAWVAAGLLDRGEAEAIALAQQLDAAWLLTDDAAARVIAENLGLEAHGSLGVVLWAAATGKITRPNAEAALNGLIASSLWLMTRVQAEARAALDRLYPSH